MAFRPRRQRRKDNMLKAGLLPFEADILSALPKGLPYINNLMRNRRNIYRQALRKDITKKQYKADILDGYRTRGWLIHEGSMTRAGKQRKDIGGYDPWAMMRAWRQAAIDSGEYIPPPPKKKKGADGRRLLDDKEVARLQAKANAKRKQKRETAPVGEVYFNTETGKYETRYF